MSIVNAPVIVGLVGLILAVTLVPLALFFGLVIWWLRRKKAAVTRQWEREGVVFLRGPVGSNFSGLESQGLMQIRGNGFIALTRHDLRITRALPPAEWRIPHRQIKGVSLESSFLSKGRIMKVLVVTFEETGRQDRIGVYVRDGVGWAEAIAHAARLPVDQSSHHRNRLISGDGQ